VSSSWLRDHEILLHIGVHKTGTSSIQATMAACRAQMLAQGVLYPGTSNNHLRAAHAALGRRRGWTGTPVPMSRWQQLVASAQSDDGKAVLSAEVLCEAKPQDIRRILEDLGPRTKALITLRPLEAIIPSTWQQYVKAGNTHPYGEWLENVLSGPRQSTLTPSFWRRNDHGRVVTRWVEVFGSDRVAILMVDSSQPRSIYDGFEDIIGLSRNTLQAQTERNRSMSAEEVELIRRLNERIKVDLPYKTYDAVVRTSLHTMIEQRRPGPDEDKLIVPGWAVERAREFGAEAVERIKATGVTVFGDLQALVPTGPITAGDLPDPPDVVPIDAVALLMEHMIRAAIELNERPAEQPKVQRAKQPKVQPADAAPVTKGLAPGPAPGNAPVPRPRTNGELAVSLLRDLKTPRKFADRIANKARRERRKLAHRMRARVSR